MSNSTNRIYYPLDTSQTKKSPARRVTSPKTTKTGIRNNYNKSPKNNTDMDSMHDTNYSYRSINNEEINQTNYREKSLYSQTGTQNIPSSSDQNNNQDDEDLISYWTEKVVVQNVDLSNPRISCKIKREILPELIKNLQSVRDACVVEGLPELSCQADQAVMACKNLLKEKRVDESSNTQTKNIQERLDQAKQELKELQERITIQEANMLNEFQSQSRKLKEKHKKELKSLQNEWFVQETIDEPLPKQEDSENDLDQISYDSMYPTAVNRNVKSPRSNYDSSILGDDNNDDNDDIFASNNNTNTNTAKKTQSNSYINDIEYMYDFAKDTIEDPTEFDNNREQFFNNNPKKERTSNSTKRKSKRKRSTKTNYNKSTKDQIYDETPNNQNDQDNSSKQNTSNDPSEKVEFNSFLKPFSDIANNIDSDNTNKQKSESQSSNVSDSDKQSQNNDDMNSVETKSNSSSVKKKKSNKQIKNSKNNDSENLSVNDSDSQNKDDPNSQHINYSDSQNKDDLNNQNKNDSDSQNNKDDSDIQDKDDLNNQNKNDSDIQNKNDSDSQNNKDDSDIQDKNDLNNQNKDDSDIQNKNDSDKSNDDDSQNNQTKTDLVNPSKNESNTSSNRSQVPNTTANVFDNAVKRFTYNVLPKNNDDLFDIDVNNYSESESSVYNNANGDEKGSIQSVSVDENYSSAPDDSETLEDSEILMTSDEQNEDDNLKNDDDESGDESDGKDMIKKMIGNVFGKMTKNGENNSEGGESEKEEKKSKSDVDNEDKNNNATKSDDENNNDEDNDITKNDDDNESKNINDENNEEEENNTTKNVDEDKNNDDEDNDTTKNVDEDNDDKNKDDGNDSASNNGDENDTSNIRSDSKSSNHSKSNNNSEVHNLADDSDKDDTQSDKNGENTEHTDDEDKSSHHSEHTKSTNYKNAFEDTDDQYDDINNKSDNDSLNNEKLDKKAASNVQRLLGNGNDSTKSHSSKQTSQSNTKSVSRSSKQTTQSNTTSISRSSKQTNESKTESVSRLSKQTNESVIDDTSSQHTKNSSIPPSKIFKRFFSDMPDLSTTTRSEEDMRVDDDKISLKKPKGYKQPNEQPNQNQGAKSPNTNDQFNETQNTTNKETTNMNQTQQNQQQQPQQQTQQNQQQTQPQKQTQQKPSTTCQKKKQKPTREMTSTELMQAPISHVVNKSQLPSKADIKSATYKKERRLRHYNKTSAQLRILRRQAAFLEKENKHDEAKIVMQQADAIEKEEVLSSTLQMRQDYEKNLESLLIRQEQEMEQLKKNQSIKRTKYENAKQESITILQRRIEKLQNEIKIASDKERANALFQRKSSLHKKNPIPTSKYQTSRDRRKKNNRNDITSDVKSANLEDGHFFDEENQTAQNLEDDRPSKSEEEQENEIDTKLSLNRNASKKKTAESSGLNRFNYYTYTSKINKNAPPGLSPALNQSLMQQLNLNVNKSLDKMNQKNPLAKKRRYPTAVSMPLTSRRQVNQAEFNRIKLPPLNASLEAKKIIKSNEKKMRLNRDYM